MEGGNNYSDMGNAATQQLYGANQYAGMAYGQAEVDQNYANYNYYDNNGKMPSADFDPSATNPASVGWYSQDNLSYTNYLPQTQYTSSAQVNSNLYKTKLCRHFQTKGFCNMGEKCNFAHGLSELKDFTGSVPPQPPASYSYPQTTMYSESSQQKTSQTSVAGHKYYKTVLCRNFTETGECQFGEKCKFAHGDQDLRAPQPGAAPNLPNYSSYAGYGGYNTAYYPPDTGISNTAEGYGYNMEYMYPAGNSIGGGFEASDPTASASFDPSQNYGYNYTPDSKYYQGFEYPTTIGGQTSISGGGSESMNQYYAENNMMNPSYFQNNNSQ